MYKFEVLVVYRLDSNELMFASVDPPRRAACVLLVNQLAPGKSTFTRMFKKNSAFIGAMHLRLMPPIVRIQRICY